MNETDGQSQTPDTKGCANPNAPFRTTAVSFRSEGVRCAGVLYRPTDTAEVVPCVVLAHGFSGTMDWIVPDFASRFAASGLAALIFDDRYLGASEGLPRQQISTPRQRVDLRNAVEFARSCEGIEPEGIALWGTSLGGGHVLDLAANDLSIAAVVANVPAIDLLRGARGRAGRPGLQLSGAQIMSAAVRLLGSAVADAAAGALKRPPHYIRVYGPPGRAVFSDPSLEELFRTVEAQAPTWRNRGHTAVPVHRTAIPERPARPDQRTASGDVGPRRRGRVERVHQAKVGRSTSLRDPRVSGEPFRDVSRRYSASGRDGSSRLSPAEPAVRQHRCRLTADSMFREGRPRDVFRS